MGLGRFANLIYRNRQRLTICSTIVVHYKFNLNVIRFPVVIGNRFYQMLSRICFRATKLPFFLIRSMFSSSMNNHYLAILDVTTNHRTVHLECDILTSSSAFRILLFVEGPRQGKFAIWGLRAVN